MPSSNITNSGRRGGAPARPPPRRPSGGGGGGGSVDASVEIPTSDCLAGDGVIQLAGTSHTKTVAELRSGDIVLAMNQAGDIVESEVLMVSHSSTTAHRVFTVLWTECGDKISLTSHHLLPIVGIQGQEHEFIFAKNVKPNHRLYIRSAVQNEIITVKVDNVTTEVKQGYYSPITHDGTIIVNNVVVSCYAVINSHQLAHVGVTPLRWIYAAIKYFSLNAGLFERTSSNDGKIHWYHRVLFDASRLLLPQLYSV